MSNMELVSSDHLLFPDPILSVEAMIPVSFHLSLTPDKNTFSYIDKTMTVVKDAGLYVVINHQMQ